MTYKSFETIKRTEKRKEIQEDFDHEKEFY